MREVLHLLQHVSVGMEKFILKFVKTSEASERTHGSIGAERANASMQAASNWKGWCGEAHAIVEWWGTDDGGCQECRLRRLQLIVGNTNMSRRPRARGLDKWQNGWGWGWCWAAAMGGTLRFRFVVDVSFHLRAWLPLQRHSCLVRERLNRNLNRELMVQEHVDGEC